MKISVALCSFNGASYLRKQLVSILNQTLKVDEIVISDDASTDDTMEIIRSVERQCEGVAFRVFSNETNVGFRHNFLKALGLCQGKLVFLADQDDIWHENKVETIVKWFTAHPEKQVVFTDADLIDSDGVPIGGSLWQRFGFDKKKQRYFDHDYALDIWGWSNRATGATMAVKKAFIDKIKWEQYENAFHDSIISWQGVVHHTIGYLDEKLIDYRLHSSQVCGADNMPREFQYSPLKPVFSDFLYPGFLENDIQFIPEMEQKKIRFILQRSTFKYTWFGWGPVSHFWKYLSYYHSWSYRFFFYDLFVSVKHSIRRLTR